MIIRIVNIFHIMLFLNDENKKLYEKYYSLVKDIKKLSFMWSFSRV